MGEETRYVDMDFSEVTKIVFNRIQKLDPENVAKITGCILLRDPGHQEMIQLAFGPDNVLRSIINDVKAVLRTLSTSSTRIQSNSQLPHQFNPLPHPGSRHLSSSPSNFHVAAPSWDPQPSLPASFVVPRPYPDSIAGEKHYSLNSQTPQFLGSEEQLDPSGSYYLYLDPAVGVNGGLPPRVSRRTSSLPEFSTKTCHYFNRGYCKHGDNCKFSHDFTDDYSHGLGPSVNEFVNEDFAFTPGSLEKLEMEVAELLRSKGEPISIASLPMLYFEKYGKNLQAEGYLTESQRHGKAGFSLTKLLERLKNSIRLLDRPHGQHFVILAEDVSKYEDFKSERSDMVASSHQIYLTFPADSTFTEEDVSNYFETFGPVRDVRIPSQDSRMFGFVSFQSPDTVKLILMRRNPHYICGARVLVKPYKDKSKMFGRSYTDKIKPATYHPSNYLDMDTELHALQKEYEDTLFHKRLMIEERMKAFEFDRRRFESGLNLVPKPLAAQQSFCGYSAQDVNNLEGPDYFPLADHFSYTLDALNNGSTSDDKAKNISNCNSEQESDHIVLPDNPFASPRIGSSISTVI